MDETDLIFSVGAFLAVREPCYQYDTESGTPVIRVDAPSDIVFVDPESELVRDVTWSNNLLAEEAHHPETAEHWRKRGNELFKQRKWLCAAIAYSEGLRTEPQNHLLLLNQAATFLELQWYHSAAANAEEVIAMKLSDPTLQRKAVIRATKAHYAAENYSKAIQLAKLLPRDADAQLLAEKSRQRIQERDRGKYDWNMLYKQSRTSASRPDVASHQGPVKITRLSGDEGVVSPYGVFTTRRVEQGELLVR